MQLGREVVECQHAGATEREWQHVERPVEDAPEAPQPWCDGELEPAQAADRSWRRERHALDAAIKPRPGERCSRVKQHVYFLGLFGEVRNRPGEVTADTAERMSLKQAAVERDPDSGHPAELRPGASSYIRHPAASMASFATARAPTTSAKSGRTTGCTRRLR